MSDELKPCPFCGGKAEMRDARKFLVVSKFSYIIPYSVGCSNKKCDVKPYTEYSSTEQEAIDAWNRRANDD
jgi:Lar family restriction alleviation protein